MKVDTEKANASKLALEVKALQRQTGKLAISIEVIKTIAALIVGVGGLAVAIWQTERANKAVVQEEKAENKAIVAEKETENILEGATQRQRAKTKEPTNRPATVSPPTPIQKPEIQLRNVAGVLKKVEKSSQCERVEPTRIAESPNRSHAISIGLIGTTTSKEPKSALIRVDSAENGNETSNKYLLFDREFFEISVFGKKLRLRIYNIQECAVDYSVDEGNE